MSAARRCARLSRRSSKARADPETPADCFVDPLGPGVEKTSRNGALGFVFFVLASLGPLLVALGVLTLPH